MDGGEAEGPCHSSLVGDNSKARLAMNRNKEISRQKRSRLSCMMLKQGFFNREVQAGNLDSLVHLKQVQADIREWYEQESRKVVL